MGTKTRAASACVAGLVAAAACSDAPGPEPAPPDGGGLDGGLADAAVASDAGRDGGRRDGSIPDGRVDAGPPDLGVDGGVPDLGDSGPAALAVVPEPVLFPGGRGSRAEVTVRNDGPGPVVIAAVAVREPSDGADSADFAFDCGGARCRLDRRLCPAEVDPACAQPSFLTVRLDYLNPDRSADDAAILRVERTGGAPLDVTVFATDAPCPIPTPIAAPVPDLPRFPVGQPVVIDGSGSDPGGEEGLGVFFWALVEAPPGEPPRLEGRGQAALTVTPARPGRHAVALSVTSGCGMPSAAPAEASFEAVPDDT